MISVASAQAIIEANKLTAANADLPLQQALHKRLASDTFSPADVPGFTQSSMDGYAFAFDGYRPGHALELYGEVPAGSKGNIELQPGQAARIFTGAPLPAGADTVVMQEKTTVSGNVLKIEDANLQIGINVRPVGGNICKGALALPKGSLLTPGAIGFLAGMGIDKVNVQLPPRVTIVVTGNELRQPGQSLAFGEVYESNSFALSTALQQVQVTDVHIQTAADRLEEVIAVLTAALENSDLVLLTGGVSVGDYDFVVKAAEACGVQQLFHRIRQRPGKPLYFGRKGDKLIAGLPGNPSSVLTCFYMYILPLLQRPLLSLSLPLMEGFAKPAGLTHFLKAYYDGRAVKILQAQESYRMSSFATANCLVMLDEETTSCDAGEWVHTYLLPF